MSFYIYQLVEPLILPNNSINHPSAISYKSLAISYQLSTIFINQSPYDFILNRVR